MFQSSDHALRWAASVKYRDIIDGPSINGMCGKSRRSTDNVLLMSLTPQEAQLQSEHIFKHVYSINDIAYQQYIAAKYLYKDDIEDLIRRVLSGLLYSAGGLHRRDIRKLVLAYCGAKVTKKELRESLHCDSNKVNQLEMQVYDVLDVIHNRVMGELETKMVEAGLVYGSYETVCA